MKKVCVLLATFNPAKFLIEQVQSIMSQKNVSIHLIIRDDGSTNKEWLYRCSKEYKEIELHEGENLGIAGNIKQLISYAVERNERYDYYAYSDQDDVWKSDKLEHAINLLESQDNKKPLLYYSNLLVCNENLQPSHMLFKQGVVKNTCGQALSQFFLYACTSVFNYNMLEELNSISFDGLEFDTITYLIAIYFGVAIYDEESYMYYRIHGSNSSGNHSTGLRQLIHRIHQMCNIGKMGRAYEGNALFLLRHYQNRMTAKQVEICDLVSSYRCSFKKKIKLLFNKEIKAGYMPRDLYNIIRIIFNKY